MVGSLAVAVGRACALRGRLPVRLGWPQGPAGAGFGPVGGGRPAPEAGTHARPRAPSAISARLGRSSDLRSAARVASGSCRWVGAGFVLQHRVRHRTRQQTSPGPKNNPEAGAQRCYYFESGARRRVRRWLGPRHVVTVARDLFPRRHSGSPGGADSPLSARSWWCPHVCCCPTVSTRRVAVVVVPGGR